ncbi:MAG TPA: hypothetical protein VMF32_24470 [Xanthobacteraceae bacterium]|nr:hypothetical protein [Xanthobacteraceae bacterium]
MIELELTEARYRAVFLAYLWRTMSISIPFGVLIGLVSYFLPFEGSDLMVGGAQLAAAIVAIYIALRWMLRSPFQGFRIALIAKDPEKPLTPP